MTPRESLGAWRLVVRLTIVWCACENTLIAYRLFETFRHEADARYDADERRSLPWRLDRPTRNFTRMPVCILDAA